MALDVFDLRGEMLFRHEYCRCARCSCYALFLCRCLEGSGQRPQVQTQISLAVQAAR